MDDARRRTIARIGGVVLVVGGLALFTLGRVGGSGADGYVAARAIDAPLLWAFAAAMGTIVLWSAHKASRGRTALDVLGWVLVPLAVLTVTRFVWLQNGPEQAQSYPSPDGSRTLVIEAVPSILDPMWEIRVESGDGLGQRYHVLNCVNGDWSNIERAQWLSSTRAKIVHRLAEGGVAEEATTVTFASDTSGRVDMSGHGLDSCTPGTSTSAR